MLELRSFRKVSQESTCQKRVTVCELLERHRSGAWQVVARESNRCEPLGGACHRMGRADLQALYPETSECNWIHAERMAIAAIPPGRRPTRAIIYGHDFPCPPCEAALRAAGVDRIEIDKGRLSATVGLR